LYQLITVQSYPLLTCLKQAQEPIGHIKYITTYYERTALENAKDQKNKQNTVFTRIKDDPAYKMTPPSQTSIFRKIPIFTLVRLLCHIVCIFNILALNNHELKYLCDK
jgi:hypothetical protein